MSIHSIQSPITNAFIEGDRVKPGRQQAREALGAALSSGDLDAARTAFSQLSEAGADDRVRRTDGPFARLQAALGAGDMQAASTAFQQMLDKQRKDPGTELSRSRPLAQEGSLGRHIDISA